MLTGFCVKYVLFAHNNRERYNCDKARLCNGLMLILLIIFVNSSAFMWLGDDGHFCYNGITD